MLLCSRYSGPRSIDVNDSDEKFLSDFLIFLFDIGLPVALTPFNLMLYVVGKCIYIAHFCCRPTLGSHSRRSDMDHTVLPAITSMPAFTS